MRILFLLAFCGFAAVHASWAQTGTIKGRVIDATTSEGLPNANVFIDQTTFGVAADVDGYFVFNQVPVGNAVVVFSFVGYKSYQASIGIDEGRTQELIVRLQPLQEQLAEVEVKGAKDKKWEADLRRFKRYFFGEDPVGSRCTLANPWVLEFSRDPQTNDLLATASQPLELSNPALGYDLKFTIKEFRYSTNFYRIAGNAQFTERPSDDPGQVMEQMRNRKESYVLSDRYFFKSLLDGRHPENGFRMYVDKPRFESTRSQVFAVEVGKSVVPWKPGPLELARAGVFRIRMPAKMEIHNNQLNSDRRVYKDVTHAVSWMEVQGGYVLVNQQGVVLNPASVINSGEMNSVRVGRMLPLNYSPDETIVVAAKTKMIRHERLREKAILVTDRESYYPGEAIRVQAFLNYGDILMRDSLSRILEVEFFNSRRQLLVSEHLAIDSGMATGTIRIPDSLRHSVAYLRAWTGWMRNYGTASFAVKPIHILNYDERPASGLPWKPSASGLLIGYDPELKGLKILATDTVDETWTAMLGVSIVDVRLSPPVPVRDLFTAMFPIRKSESIPHMDFTHPIRRHLTLEGQTVDSRGKPVKGKVMAVLGDRAEVYMAETDANGRFRLDSLIFSDSVQVATQVQLPRAKAEAEVRWTAPSIPFVDFPSVPFSLSTEPAAEPFRIAPDSRLLRPVTVTDKKPEKPTSQPYGQPDHVLTGEQLLATKTGASLLNSLQGKVPGMQIISTFDSNGARYKIVMRGGTTSIIGSLEPQVFINGVPATASDGSAASVLEQINPLDVDRVEIITRTNAMMGALGSNGLIAVYTKVGITPGISNNGFRVRTFKGLQIHRPERAGWIQGQPTVYWQPRIGMGNGGVLLPWRHGAGRFLVRINGMTGDNRPVHLEQVVEIPD